jgi:hypothetical protein
MSNTLPELISKYYNWSLDYTNQVIFEYERFIYLKSNNPNVCPSTDIYKLWKYHNLVTENYYNYCLSKYNKIINFDFIDNLDKDQYISMLLNTITLYKSAFGEITYKDIWNCNITLSIEQLLLFNNFINNSKNIETNYSNSLIYSGTNMKENSINVSNFSVDKQLFSGMKMKESTGSLLLSGNPSSQLLPGTQNTQLLPGTQNTQLLPGTQNTQLLPGTQNTQLLPGTQNTQLLPGTQNTQLLSGTQNTQLLSGTQNTQLLSGTNVDNFIVNNIYPSYVENKPANDEFKIYFFYKNDKNQNVNTTYDKQIVTYKSSIINETVDNLIDIISKQLNIEKKRINIIPHPLLNILGFDKITYLDNGYIRPNISMSNLLRKTFNFLLVELDNVSI